MRPGHNLSMMGFLWFSVLTSDLNQTNSDKPKTPWILLNHPGPWKQKSWMGCTTFLVGFPVGLVTWGFSNIYGTPGHQKSQKSVGAMILF